MKNLNLKFRVHNEQHSEAIQKRLFELGYKWSNGDVGVADTKKSYLYADSSFGYGTTNDFFEKDDRKEATLDELYKMSKPNTVKLNDEMTAEIYDDKVVVGCQEFTHKSIKKLYKKVKEHEKH